MHLHKLLVHSIFVFKKVNLTACSCEGGEGMIAVMKHLFRFRNRTLDETFRTVLLRLLFKEKDRFVNLQNSMKHIDDSKVFTAEFIESYSPKTLRVVVFHSSFSNLTEFFTLCGFSEMFINETCDIKRITRNNKLNTKKVYTFKRKKDAIVMKEQLVNSRNNGERIQVNYIPQ